MCLQGVDSLFEILLEYIDVDVGDEVGAVIRSLPERGRLFERPLDWDGISRGNEITEESFPANREDGSAPLPPLTRLFLIR